ncbi:MAG: TonB-dependent receptor plug domain-containing protein [Sphingomonas sp.]
MTYSTARLFGATASGIALLAAAPAFAQAAPANPQEDPGDTITVTGSRLSDRTVADSPVPIDVITAEQLTTSGFTETNKVLNQLVPSFNFPQPSLTDGTDSLRPATLRGLSPDQVLVLVNGKRRHTAALLNLNGSVGRGSSAVDLNEIPPIAIDRIEVLRDGASSLYGSDAIAGVINLGLSKKTGVRAQVTYGQYETTLSGVSEISGVQTGANGLPVVATAGGGSNDLLQLITSGPRRRSDGATITLATSLGLPVGDRGYFVASGQFVDRDPTNRSGADPRRQYPTIGDPRELTFNRFSHRFGDGKAVDFNFFVNAGYDLLPDVQVYAFGSYGIRDANGAGFYRRANDVRNRDFAASTTTFVPFYPDGFLPLIASQIEDVSGTLGVKGDIGGGWNADLSVVYGSNQLDYSVENSFNVSLGGLNSPRVFDAGGIAAGQTVVNLDFSHKFDLGFVKSFGLAFGGEYRDENFKIRQGSVASFINGPFTANGAAGGAQVFPGFRPNNEVDVSRNSFAGYAEIDTDIIDALNVQVAGRFEHFSDFGDTLNGKIAARLELIKGIAVRGSISTGFRAPSLAQQFFATTSTNNVGGQLIEVGTFPVSDRVAIALGSRQLRAEKATNFGGGLTFAPVRGLNVTVDYYNIGIRDRVTLTENLQGAAVVGILQAAGINNVTSARFFVNGVNTRTQGVDVVATYRLPDFGAGRFRFTAGYNYNTTAITSRATLPSLPGLLLFGRTESFRLTDGQPRDKLNLSLDWSLGKFGANIRTNRFGSVFVPGGSTNIALGRGDGPGDFTLTPKWVTDVEAHVGLIRGFDIAVGANNVFDVYPDRSPAGGVFGNNAFFLPYSSLSPFGFNGRFLYVRGSINF